MLNVSADIPVFDAAMQEARRFWKAQLERRPIPSGPLSDFDRRDSVPLKRTVEFEARDCVVERLALSTGESPFLTFVAVVWAIHLWLSRATGVSRHAIGSSALKGAPPNAIPLLLELDARHAVHEQLAKVRQIVRDAYARQGYPYDYMRRDAGLVPMDRLFHLAVAADGLHGPLPDLNPDIALTVRWSSHRLFGTVMYDAAIFRNGSIRAFWDQLQTILHEGFSDPERSASALVAVNEADVRRLTREANATACEYPDGACLNELFEARCADAPDNLAIVSQNGGVATYREIDARASHLAAALRGYGAGPNRRVGVLLNRSIELATTLLGIAKAGAAYVPIDPSYPRERIAFLAEDADLTLIVSTPDLATSAPPHVPVVAPDAQAISRSVEADQSPARPADLAYLIYTSGSSGVPKGVLLDHRGRVNNFTDFNRRFRIGPEDRLFAVSALGFDMTAYDVFGTWAAGAAIVTPDPAHEKRPETWAALMREHRVTIWQSAPILFDLLLFDFESHPDRPLPPLRLVLLGGDWIPVSMLARARALFPDASLVALGGATEASVHSTIFVVGDIDEKWRSVPYGRPMANQTTYILDREMRVAPLGVPGELCLGGVGIGWGYWHRSDLTAEKFVPNPYGGGGERIYRTGDLARWLPDGEIELLGRMDTQVKIRGMRVEPSEIEVTLKSHAAVRDCAVVTARDGVGDKVLMAYVVAADDAELDEGALRRFVADRLPPFMIPASFVRLSALPVTPNGKLDRRGLAASTAAALGRSRDRVAPPTTPLEVLLVGRWREVLGVDEVGIDDDFFELGGDSLKAMKACQLPGRAWPLVELYHQRTIRRLCAEADAAGARRIHAPLHAVRRATEGSQVGTLLCVPYGGGSPIVYYPLADWVSKRWRIDAVDLPGRDPTRLDERAWTLDEAASICLDALACEERGPYVLYGHCGGVALATEIARRLETRGDRVEAVVLGGALLPPEQVGRDGLPDPFHGLSDAELHARLVTLGAFESLDPAYVPSVTMAFRHDGQQAREYFHRHCFGPARARIRAPLTCVVGDADPLTPHFDDAYKRWTK